MAHAAGSHPPQAATFSSNVRVLRAGTQDPPPEALPPGTRLAEFEVLGVLGTGGFGIVYLARDLALDRRVAIKEYLPVQLALRGGDGRIRVRAPRYAATFDKGLRAFANEARLLAGLDHPAMVKVHRYWDANGTGYMAMPHVEGATLRQARRRGRLATDEAALRALLAPLLDALEMLHARGVTHRDIAPDNILLRPDGRPVLLDFGSARRVAGSASETLTAVLKPRYAPIEQYGENTQVRQGPWTDIYALGGVVAYLLEGRPPPAATARAVHDERVPLAELGFDGVSRGFLAALDWALAVRPQDRPQSVADFRAALEGRLRPPRASVARRGAADHWLPVRAGSAFAGVAALALVAATWLATPHAPQAASPLAAADASARFGGSGSMLRVRSADAIALGEMPAARRPAMAAAALDIDTALPAAVPLPNATPAALAQPGATPAALAQQGSAPAALAPPSATLAPASLRAVPAPRPAAASLPPARSGAMLPPPRAARLDDPLRSCPAANPLMRALCMNQRCSSPHFQFHPRCAYLQRSEQLLVGRDQIAGR